MKKTLTLPMALFVVMRIVAAESQADSWKMHSIDRSSKGADGVRLGDVDRDGRPDIATGWEEGGRIRICFGAAADAVRRPWRSIEIGKVNSPEDAVFADVNSDGWLDVVSCCEGKQQGVFFHINPGNGQVRNSSSWVTQELKAVSGISRWMFCEPFPAASGQDKSFLIVGSKEPNAQISMLQPDGLGQYQPAKLRTAGWIMTLRRFDVDDDGDPDLVYSDRKGNHRGIGWLENSETGWHDHEIGGADSEVMFLDITRIDGRLLLACSARTHGILLFAPSDDPGKPWTMRRISQPVDCGSGKGVAIGDMDGDGSIDLCCTCEHAAGKHGVFWLSEPEKPDRSESPDGSEAWTFHEISGTERGVKFDRIELVDLDEDGDLDLLTCEERDNLGVIWYENPVR